MLDAMNTQYKIQIASDIVRDGLGAELLDEDRNVIAEVFRCDRNNTITVSTFSNAIPVSAMHFFLKTAAERLGNFEDGTPINIDASGG